MGWCPTGQTRFCEEGRKMVEIRNFDIMSVAKIYGVMMAIMGVVIGLIYGAMFALIGMASGGSVAMGAIVGIIAIILVPIVYGILGFILGAVGALIYNAVAPKVGGVRFNE